MQPHTINTILVHGNKKDYLMGKLLLLLDFHTQDKEYDNGRIRAKFDGSALRQNTFSVYGAIVNIYIVYRLIPRTNNSNIVLENCLFSAIQITKNDNPDKYIYSGGYGIGFDSKWSYTQPDGGYGKNTIIFGADLSTCKHANNTTKDVSVLGRDFIQKIGDTTVYAEKMYSSNITVDNKTFCLSLHYNGDNSYLFANGKEVITFKAKAQNFRDTHPYSLRLGNISGDSNQADKISTGFYGYVHDFSIGYEAIAVENILDIHKYLMEKNNIK